MSECCICTRPNEFSCPSCDEPFCFSCFVDHGKSCYAQMKQKAEQKKCSVCGRYASINPTVHCSDCQIEICRSCLWAHKKTHEKWTCVFCGHPDTPGKFALCGTCNKPVCSGCNEKHQRIHKSYCAQCGNLHYNDILNRCPDCHKLICVSCGPAHKKTHHKKCSGCNGDSAGPFVSCPDCGRELCEACMEMHKRTHASFCVNCGKPKSWAGRFSTCPICHAPVCSACESVHAYNHTKASARCFTCGKRTATECNECRKPFCSDCFPAHNRVHHEQPPQHANARTTYTHINLDDFKIKFDEAGDLDFLKKQMEEMRRIREEAEAERRKREQQMRTCSLCHKPFARLVSCPECKQQCCASCYPNHAYQHRMKRQQEDFFNNFFGGQRTSGTATAQPTTQDAFRLLGLSTRATVQEVKRAFKRKAKETHPDVGGTKEAFVKLNNAYEVALAHAERNER